MGYKFVEELTYADVAFEAEGNSLEELFKFAGEATTKTMIENPEIIEEKEIREISIEAEDNEKLLFKFLDEILFYKDADMLIFKSYNIKIDGNKLTATLKGEVIDNKKHKMLVDVKAVSYHHFKLEKLEDKWKAFVILDV